jgi:hypothetical protein
MNRERARMLCVRCGSTNPNHEKTCGNCGAVLPRNLGQTEGSSVLDLQDGRSYAAPDKSYPNAALDALEDTIDGFLEGKLDQQAVLAQIDQLEALFGSLLACLPDTLEAIEQQKEADPDDLPHHIGYLVQMGTSFFNDGLALIEEALDGSDEQIDRALDELRKGNDYICHSSALISELFAREGQTVEIPESAPADETETL